MATTSADTPNGVIDIPAEQYDVARRYIVAIVERDRRAEFDWHYAQRLTSFL
jgi:hypothetical protein